MEKEIIKHKLHYPVIGGAGQCSYCGKQNPDKDEVCESAMLARDEAEAEADALAGQAEYEAQQQAEAEYEAQEAEAQAEAEANQEPPPEEFPF